MTQAEHSKVDQGVTEDEGWPRLRLLLSQLYRRAGVRQPELQALAGTYDFFDAALVQYADPLERAGRRLHSFERDGHHLEINRSPQEVEYPYIHVSLYQPSGGEFSGVVHSLNITPDDHFELSAELNRTGEREGLPKPEANLDEVLRIAKFVLAGPAIYIK